jgi:hypothetical protein
MLRLQMGAFLRPSELSELRDIRIELATDALAKNQRKHQSDVFP